MTSTSGTTTSGNTGAVRNRSGAALGVARDDANTTVGSGNTGQGGLVVMAAGGSTAATGGSVTIISGESTATTSGAITIPLPNAGAKHVSGAVVCGSGNLDSGGTTSSGTSGVMHTENGAATTGASGAVSLTVGTGTFTAAKTLTLDAGAGIRAVLRVWLPEPAPRPRASLFVLRRAQG